MAAMFSLCLVPESCCSLSLPSTVRLTEHSVHLGILGLSEALPLAPFVALVRAVRPWGFQWSAGWYSAAEVAILFFRFDLVLDSRCFVGS